MTDWYKCTICDRRLNRVRAPNGRVIGYQHAITPPDLHEPDPVAEADTGQAQLVCDFCNNLDPVWEYPCAAFRPTAMSNISQSISSWMACETCAEMVEHERWGRLIARVIATFEENQGSFDQSLRHSVISRLQSTYQQFSENRQGPRRRL